MAAWRRSKEAEVITAAWIGLYSELYSPESIVLYFEDPRILHYKDLINRRRLQRKAIYHQNSLVPDDTGGVSIIATLFTLISFLGIVHKENNDMLSVVVSFILGSPESPGVDAVVIKISRPLLLVSKLH